MDDSGRTKMPDEEIATCTTHPGNISNYHCETHNYTGCYVCFTTVHRNCATSSTSISDLATGTAIPSYYNGVQQMLSELTGKLNDFEPEAVNSEENLEESGSQYMSEVKIYRDKLVAYIDELVDKAEAKKQKVMNEGKEQINNARNFGKDHLRQLEAAKLNISDSIKNGYANKIFVLNQAERLMQDCQQSIDSAKQGLHVKPCVFARNIQLEDQLVDNDSIGEIMDGPCLCREINVRQSNDSTTSDVTASHTLADSRLIVTDYANCSVKLFDKSFSLNSCVRLPSNPHNIAEVSSNFIAVNLLENRTEKQIQFITVSDELTRGQTIDLHGVYCRSLAVCDNNLLTHMDNWFADKINLHDMSGKRLQTICSSIEYVSCQNMVFHPSNRQIYFSYEDYVTCFTMEGTQRGTYKNDDLKAAVGLAVHPDDTIYVCGKESNNIHHISTDCQKIEILLNDGELTKPQSVSFSLDGDTMYVSEVTSNKLKVFSFYI